MVRTSGVAGLQVAEEQADPERETSGAAAESGMTRGVKTKSEIDLEEHEHVDDERERAHAKGARAPVKIISRKVSVMRVLKSKTIS